MAGETKGIAIKVSSEQGEDTPFKGLSIKIATAAISATLGVAIKMSFSDTQNHRVISEENVNT